MLTRTLGARVFSYPDQRARSAIFRLAGPHADALCAAPFPRQVYQWHRDGFDLPIGAQLIAAGGEHFPIQAYRYGARAVALQFHPEVTYQMMCRWTVRGAERLTLPGAQPRDWHLDGWRRYDAAVAKWSQAFLAEWLAGSLPALEREPQPALRRWPEPGPSGFLTPLQRRLTLPMIGARQRRGVAARSRRDRQGACARPLGSLA